MGESKRRKAALGQNYYTPYTTKMEFFHGNSHQEIDAIPEYLFVSARQGTIADTNNKAYAIALQVFRVLTCPNQLDLNGLVRAFRISGQDDPDYQQVMELCELHPKMPPEFWCRVTYGNGETDHLAYPADCIPQTEPAGTDMGMISPYMDFGKLAS